MWTQISVRVTSTQAGSDSPAAAEELLLGLCCVGFEVIPSEAIFADIARSGLEDDSSLRGLTESFKPTLRYKSVYRPIGFLADEITS